MTEVNWSILVVIEQYVDQATRVNNILDIFGTNDDEPVAKVSVEELDSKTSDHRLILVQTSICLTESVDCDTSTTTSGLFGLNFWSPDTDWDKIKAGLGEIQWKQKFEPLNIDAMLDNLPMRSRKFALSMSQ